MELWNKINDRKRWQGIVLWICVAALLVNLLSSLTGNTLNPTATQTYSWLNMTNIYVLKHGNIIHLLINLNAMLIVAFKMYVKGWKWLCGLGISICYPTRWITVPIIGMSGWVYAMLGLMTMSVKSWRWMLLVNVLTIAMGAMMPGIAWGMHAWSYGLGLAISLAVEPIYKR